MNKRSLPVFLLALGLLGANLASADTIIFQEGTLLPGGGAYTGTQDTEIVGAIPATSYGSNDSMRTDLFYDPGSGGAEVQALLRFDSLFGPIPDQIPLTATITSAVITLYATNYSTVPIGNISVYQMTSTWDETSTWNSMVGGVQIGSETEAVADDSHSIESIGFTSFDVLDSLQAWLGGDSNFGWVIVNDSTDGVEFATSEYTTDTTRRPMLTVTFTPVPEPGSLQLVCLAAVAALCVRRLRRSR